MFIILFTCVTENETASVNIDTTAPPGEYAVYAKMLTRICHFIVHFQSIYTPKLLLYIYFLQNINVLYTETLI